MEVSSASDPLYLRSWIFGWLTSVADSLGLPPANRADPNPKY